MTNSRRMAHAVAVAVLVIAGMAGVSGTASAAGFRIFNDNSGECLVARAGSGERPVVQTDCGVDRSDQHWQLVSIDPANLWYRIRSADLGLCITTRAGVETKAVATTCNPGSTLADWPDQIWQYQFDGNSYRLQNRASGLYLVARGQQVESQAVQTWSCPTCADQYWFDV